MMVVKIVEESNKSITSVARELEINVNTFHGWIHKFKHGADAFLGSSHLYGFDEEMSCIRKEIM